MRQKFIIAVDEHDLVRVRLLLSNELLLDPRGISFREMLDFAEGKLIDLFQPHDGAILQAAQETWDQNLLFKVQHELEGNFSRDRLLYYERMAKVVLSEKSEALENEEKTSTPKPILDEDEYTQNGNFGKQIAVGIIIAGIMLLIAGFCVSGTIVITLGGAGVIAGGIWLLSNKNK